SGMPPPSAEEQPHPIGVAPPLPTRHGPYRFARLQPSSSDPVAYDPCRPVHIVVNTRDAPAERDELLRSALERLNETTGLNFVVDASEIMNPVGSRTVTDYADGDRAGLALLGRGHCFAGI